jgi:hypothetical protein
LIILAWAALRLLSRLSDLRYAASKLDQRRGQALDLQASVAELEQTLAAVQQRTEAVQDHVAVIKAGTGAAAD